MSWLPRQVPPKSFGDEWKVEPFGALNHYRVTLDPMGPRAAEYITGIAQAGNVDLYFEIPYPHRFCRFEFKHTGATGADDATAHSFYFARYKWASAGSPFQIYSSVNSINYDDARIAGDGYEYPPGKYRLRVNITETYRIYPEIIVQILGKPFDQAQKKGPIGVR